MPDKQTKLQEVRGQSCFSWDYCSRNASEVGGLWGSRGQGRGGFQTSLLQGTSKALPFPSTVSDLCVFWTLGFGNFKNTGYWVRLYASQTARWMISWQEAWAIYLFIYFLMKAYIQVAFLSFFLLWLFTFVEWFGADEMPQCTWLKCVKT